MTILCPRRTDNHVCSRAAVSRGLYFHGRESVLIFAKIAVFRKIPKIPIPAQTVCALGLVKIVGGTMQG